MQSATQSLGFLLIILPGDRVSSNPPPPSDPPEHGSSLIVCVHATQHPLLVSRDGDSSGGEDDSTAQRKLMRPVNREGDPSYRSEMKRISLGALEACMRIWEAVGSLHQ